MTTTSKLQTLLNLTIKTFYTNNSTGSIKEIYNYLNKISLNDEIDLSFISEAHKLLNEFNKYKISTTHRDYNRYLNIFLKDKEKNYDDKNKFFNISMYIQSDAPVLHLEIYEKHPFISLTMFLLRKGNKMPLHNHPNMNGVIKVLHGNGIVNSYTLNERNLNDNLITAKQEFSKNVTTDDLLAVEPVLCNLHEMIASKESDLVFFDLIVPPYESNCSYYEVINSSNGLVNLKLFNDPPSYYFCDSLIYTGPKLSI